MTHYVTITPRDPLIARDGRPFGIGQGNRMRSLDWLYPSVLAGSLRTLLGKRTDPTFGPETVKALKGLSVAGPLPAVDRTLFLPRPLDCVVSEKGGNRRCLSLRPRPFGDGEGCDLPAGLQPVLLPEDSREDFKPAQIPGFWSSAKMAEWLTNPTGVGFHVPPPDGHGTDGFLEMPPKDVRVHVKMDADTGAGKKEDALFITTGLDFSRKKHATPVQLRARVIGDNGFTVALDKLDDLHPLGGERRLAHWRADAGDSNLWDCPDQVKRALPSNEGIRMVLATPAIFSAGWKPGWLSEGENALEGCPPGSAVRLQLVGAIVERWRPLSGWSLEPPVGPKAIRRMVPAGSVYFFKMVSGDGEGLTKTWLQSVCDEQQDRHDGFGLALWGTWNRHDKKEDTDHG